MISLLPTAFMRGFFYLFPLHSNSVFLFLHLPLGIPLHIRVFFFLVAAVCKKQRKINTLENSNFNKENIDFFRLASGFFQPPFRNPNKRAHSF